MTHGELGSSALGLMLLLGAYHGLNPGMGWLFAVALGMQEQKRDGGALACADRVGARAGGGRVVFAAVLLGVSLPLAVIRSIVAALLLGLGVFFLVHHWHPRWVRMQVGFGDLTLWSFLMATAHGAGLMVLPVLLGSSTVEAAGQAATLTWPLRRVRSRDFLLRPSIRRHI